MQVSKCVEVKVKAKKKSGFYQTKKKEKRVQKDQRSKGTFLKKKNVWCLRENKTEKKTNKTQELSAKGRRNRLSRTQRSRLNGND